MLSEIITGLKKGFSLLENEKFEEAEKVFKAILEKDPKNAHGHLGMLLAETSSKKVSHLELVNEDFSLSEHFKNAIKYGDKDITSALEHCVKAASKRKAKEEAEAIRKAEEEKAERERLAIIEAEEKARREKEQKIEDEQNLLALQVKEKTKTQKKKKRQKSLALLLAIIAVVSTTSVLFLNFYSKKEKLNSAKELLDKGDYVQAYLRYQELEATDELSAMKSNANKYVQHLAELGDYDEIFALSRVMQKTDIPHLDAYQAIIEGNYKKAVEQGLTKLTYNKTAKQITAEKFFGCDALEEIVIPNGISIIGAFAFEGCPNLKKITLPDSLSIIEENAFSGCSALEEIYIPQNVYFIGRNAFFECTALQKVGFEKIHGWMANGKPFSFVSEQQTAFAITSVLTDSWINN